MGILANHPLVLSVVGLIMFWLVGDLGYRLRSRMGRLDQEEREDLTLVLTATLTLLGLIIGFTFSMAISRYDLRKHYEAEEANSIGTEYQRADLLPSPESDTVKNLLKRYLELRIKFYETRNDQGKLQQLAVERAKVQDQMWSTVASVKPSPTVALAVSGMNNVIDNQGYAQAAWWNRIPLAAWALLTAIAICSNFLVGYSTHRHGNLVYLVLPLAIAISFLLIADIDSPRGGIIHVKPDNLKSLGETMGR